MCDGPAKSQKSHWQSQQLTITGQSVVTMGFLRFSDTFRRFLKDFGPFSDVASQMRALDVVVGMGSAPGDGNDVVKRGETGVGVSQASVNRFMTDAADVFVALEDQVSIDAFHLDARELAASHSSTSFSRAVSIAVLASQLRWSERIQ